ncbi:MAG: hypothetical protein U9R26_10930 [Campylobacterota bacterium]|nr:hypothetical protein [Campylobacterota bacterium]
MNEILLSNQVIVYLLSESILFGLLFIAFVITLGILVRWDFGSYSEQQFRLERRAYLVMTILLFVFMVKFLLLVYFVFAIDSLSLLVPGAMCAAGVISANDYGMLLLFLKLVILLFLLLWMALNRYDLQAKNYPLFRIKSWLFVAIFLVIAIETGMDFAYFAHIDTLEPVNCCSTLYGQLEGANPLPFGLSTITLLVLFYLLYMVVMGATLSGQKILSIVGSLLFVVIAYYSVVYFFGTYIYELPTHNCPFCMLQKEYYYVGYLVWGTLFVGTYLGLISSVMEIGLKVERRGERHIALVLLSLFVLLCTGYVAVYYLRNGVFL